MWDTSMTVFLGIKRIRQPNNFSSLFDQKELHSENRITKRIRDTIDHESNSPSKFLNFFMHEPIVLKIRQYALICLSIR